MIEYDEGIDYVVAREEIDKIIKQKKKPSYIENIPIENWDSKKKLGWEIIKQYKKTYKIEKVKSQDDVFEDKVWVLLADMGFKYLSNDRHKFKLQIDNGQNKQIDVFGIDEDVVVIAECKSAEKPDTKKEFKGDILEIANYKGRMSQILNSHFKSTKPKYIFMFCTANYIVSREDQSLMKEKNIVWFEDSKIDYYCKLTQELGVLSKYQFLGELLEGKRIPGMADIKVPAIKTRMGKYDCYSMMIEPKRLLNMCFVLHRSDNSDSNHTYQRYVKRSRIEAIKSYIDRGGFFPNSIIINFDNSSLNFEQAPKNFQTSDNCVLGNIILPAEYKSAFIIDGQHRLYGYAGTSEQENAVIPVIAFEKLPPEEQTRMFVDINNKAKSVKRTLIESLNGELYWNSSNKKYALHALMSVLIITLNKTTNSPLYNCIQIGETSNKKNKEKINLTYFLDLGLKAEHYFVKDFHKNGTPLAFGPLYDGDLAEKSLKKAYDVLSAFYEQIKMQCSSQWKVLLSNVGISTLSNLLSEFMMEVEQKEGVLLCRCTSKEIINLVKPRLDILCAELSKKTETEVQRYIRYLGYGGVKEASRHFERLIYEVDSSFTPEGLEQWIIKESGEYTNKTIAILDDIIPQIIEKTQEVLVSEYGEQYILEIPTEIIDRIKQRKKTDPNKSCYLEIEDIRTIALEMWQGTFDKILGDNEKGDKNKRTAYLSDLEKAKEDIQKNKMISEEQLNRIIDIRNFVYEKFGKNDDKILLRD